MKDSTNRHDALVLLTEGHADVDKLVREFERRRKVLSPLDKGKLALRLCRALALQGKVKREVLLPAAAAVLDAGDPDVVATARLALEELLRLAARVEGLPSRDADFEPAVLLLGEQARAVHAREASELLPRLRHSGLDLKGAGERMAALAAQASTAPIGRRQIGRVRRVMAGEARRATGGGERR